MSKSAQSLSRNAGSGGRVLSSRGWSKARAVSVPIVASTSMTCAMGALLPPCPGPRPIHAGVGLRVCCSLLAGWSRSLCALVYGGAPLTAEDHHALGPVLAVLSSHGLGPPTVRFWVRHGSPSDGRHLSWPTVCPGQPRPDRGDQLWRGGCRACGNALGAGLPVWCAAERRAATCSFASGPCPWVFLTYGMVRAARGFGVLPLVRMTWKARWLLTVVAAAQAMAESHVALAGLVVGIGAISYLWPRWVRAWQTECQVLGDEAAAALRASTTRAGHALRREPQMDRTPDWPAELPWPAIVT